MNALQPLPTLADRPRCGCGIGMWLCDTTSTSVGVLCTFQCPVCDPVAAGVISMQRFTARPPRNRKEMDAAITSPAH